MGVAGTGVSARTKHTAEQQESLVTVAALPGTADSLQVGVGGGRLSLVVIIPLAVCGLLESPGSGCCLYSHSSHVMETRRQTLDGTS